MSSTEFRVQKRPAAQRGLTDLGWLQSRHTFSFGAYQDDRFNGFRALRVINDDIVAPGKGFATHAHRDMEILSLVLEGALEHKDSLGNGRVIRAGEMQYMCAGTGVRHSEFNPSPVEPVHFLQIWILPDANGHEPSYEERSLRDARATGPMTLLASGDGRDGSIRIHRNADMWLGRVGPDQSLTVEEDNAHDYAWLHVISGAVEVGSERLQAGDGASIVGPLTEIGGVEDADLLLFRLA